MSTKKYVRDYIIQETYDPAKKKFRQQVSYIGKYYAFREKDERERKKTKIFFTVLTGVSYAAYIPLFLLNTDCGKTWFTMAPLIFLVLPFLFLGMGLYRVLTATDRNTREHRDKTEDRMKTVNVIDIILTGLALIGHIVYSALGYDKGADFWYYPLTLVILGAAILMLTRCGRLAMDEVTEG